MCPEACTVRLHPLAGARSGRVGQCQKQREIDSHRIEADAKSPSLAGLCALDRVSQAGDADIVRFTEGGIVVGVQSRALQLC